MKSASARPARPESCSHSSGPNDERQRKLLEICPGNLRKQWSQELADKFFLSSLILETRTFNEALRAGNLDLFNPTALSLFVSVPRSKEPYVRQSWNLVVIDEAHNLRNVYRPIHECAMAGLLAVFADYAKREIMQSHTAEVTMWPAHNKLELCISRLEE